MAWESEGALDRMREYILKEFESLRIDVDTECQYRDPTGALREKYEWANEMLDDCISVVNEAWIKMM